MIEKLFDSAKIPDSPQYRQAMAQIIEAEEQLAALLSASDQTWLTTLSDAYASREGAVAQAAFREGFRACAELERDLLSTQGKN